MITITANVSDSSGASAIATATATATATGSGYDNTANWAGLSNRPVSAGKILSWIGPLNGGPSTISDTPQTLALTTSGAVKSTAAGQVIQGLMISTSANAITVAHNNVTVRRNSLTVNTYPGLGVMLMPGVTGTVIEDNEVIGVNSLAQGGLGGIGGTMLTAPMVNAITRRNRITGVEKGICMVHQGCLHIDNLFHAMAGTDCDMTQFYVPGGPCFNSIVQHNYFDTRDTLAGSINDSAINITNWPGSNPITNISFINNAVIWSGPHLAPHCVLIDASQGSGLVSGINLIGNGFFGTTSFAEYNYKPALTQIAQNSGNFIMATPQATSGALVHGTGAI